MKKAFNTGMTKVRPMDQIWPSKVCDYGLEMVLIFVYIWSGTKTELIVNLFMFSLSTGKAGFAFGRSSVK